MSVHVLSWVLRNSEETLGRRLVLLVLADHAKEDGSGAWPSVETIAAETRLSERQVRRCLRDLEASGSIVETGRSKKGTHVYEVAMGGTICPPEGRTSTTEGGDRITPEPSLDQPSKVRERLRLSRTALDSIFDALAAFAGLDPRKLNRAESGRIVAARRDIIESLSLAYGDREELDLAAWIDQNVDRVVAEIQRRGREYVKEWPKAERTATALAANWSRFEKVSREVDEAGARAERGRRLRERIAEQEGGAA